jgi:hypothetical protein
MALTDDKGSMRMNAQPQLGTVAIQWPFDMTSNVLPNRLNQVMKSQLLKLWVS